MAGEIISEPLKDKIAEAVAQYIATEVKWTGCSCNDPDDGTCWYHLDEIERARSLALGIIRQIPSYRAALLEIAEEMKDGGSFGTHECARWSARIREIAERL